MAGNVCANVDQIRRQGRWNYTTINGAYLTNLPRELVRSMAGFPTCGRFFYLARAALKPPTILCKKLFPVTGEWHDRLAAKELSPGDPIQPTVAENAFVQMIMTFRKTFIQDSVLMMEPHPYYPIWQHSIFSDPSYLSFKRDLPQIEAQEHDPAHTLLQQCVPMHSGFQPPIGYKIIFFARPVILLLLPLVITFLPLLTFSLLHDVKRTNERANERTNGNSPLLTSCSSFAYLTNFLPFASFLFLMTLDRLRR
ncbi:hypothetical protein [Absidia glauca]|uniref:Ndc10 domain-containing protein n=1 Tax=Absidia glauca TaxID=4829 RepID=A0A163M359_ABSGL|nr:hypothetical protein [Absidia glauca]